MEPVSGFLDKHYLAQTITHKQLDVPFAMTDATKAGQTQIAIYIKIEKLDRYVSE